MVPDQEFRELLNLVMVSDPWPLDDESEKVVTGFLEREAQERGFDTWTEAYHEMEAERPVEPDQ